MRGYEIDSNRFGKNICLCLKKCGIPITFLICNIRFYLVGCITFRIERRIAIKIGKIKMVVSSVSEISISYPDVFHRFDYCQNVTRNTERENQIIILYIS